MSATIRDVAKYANVGVGTVSRVINASESVSAATRQKVLAVIEELNYVPNPNARRLSTGRTMTIGVMAPFFSRESVIERLRGTEPVISKSGYSLNLFKVATPRHGQSHELYGNYTHAQIDGLLVIGCIPSEVEIKRLSEAQIPIVTIDAKIPKVSSVDIDNVQGGMQATQHLIGLGHQKIGFVSGPREKAQEDSANIKRYAGYLGALRKARISNVPAYELTEGNGRYEGYTMAKKLLSLADPPTAIVAATDKLAVGVLRAAQEFNIRVPYELSVIGFNDVEMAEYVNLTTVHQPLFESGKMAMTLLLEHLETPSLPPREMRLPTKVIVRGTTAVPRL